MIARAAKVSPIPRANTTEEWPSENQKPTESGRLPSDMSLRVVLSMAEMWSASKPGRGPPGRVWDGRDGVGIKGGAKPERIGGRRHADTEELGVLGQDGDDEDA